MDSRWLTWVLTVGFDGSTITISTSLGFARRKILQQAPIIEECLSEAAFQPVGLIVELSQAEGPQSVEAIAQVTSEEAGLMSAPDSGWFDVPLQFGDILEVNNP